MAHLEIALEIAREQGRVALSVVAVEWEKEDPKYAEMAGRLETNLRILLDALDAQEKREEAGTADPPK